MNVSGFSFWYPMIMSLTIFGGSLEFVAVSMLLAEHDPGYQHTFWSEEKELHARQFAANLLKESCEMRLE